MAVKKAKIWYNSKTIWLNTAAILSVALGFIIKSGAISDEAILALLIAVLNIIVRFRTNTAVKIK